MTDTARSASDRRALCSLIGSNPLSLSFVASASLAALARCFYVWSENRDSDFATSLLQYPELVDYPYPSLGSSRGTPLRSLPSNSTYLFSNGAPSQIMFSTQTTVIPLFKSSVDRWDLSCITIFLYTTLGRGKCSINSSA